MIVNVQLTVGAPIERVFDLMADTRNEPAWNSQVSKATLDSAEPIGQSSRFTTVNRGRSFQATITEFERPTHMRYDVVGNAMTISGTLDFSEAGPSTVLAGSFEFTGHGAMKVVLPIMAPAIRRDFPKQMASFKAFCESGAAAGS